MNKLMLQIFIPNFFTSILLFTVFINLLFDSRLFHNTIRNINGVLWHCSIFLSLYKEKCFKICNLKDSNEFSCSGMFKIIGLLLLLYQNQYLILVAPIFIRVKLLQ